MRDHAAEAVALLRGRSRQDLDEDRLLNLALVRLVEIVGEAASRVPATEQERFVAIPWREVVGMRNRLVHGYDQVDFGVLWQVVQDDLPSLVKELDRMLAEDPLE